MRAQGLGEGNGPGEADRGELLPDGLLVPRVGVVFPELVGADGLPSQERVKP
ncbi:hypothetical protein [Sinomonas humi]|uniref:hypothetical protein n=1 Tax=Sinomonas humi TaxID=1338436 RepID=UPI0012E00D0F|nr:hypothetical protein [Sinomonas humi]